MVFFCVERSQCKAVMLGGRGIYCHTEVSHLLFNPFEDLGTLHVSVSAKLLSA
jgi:hypothetical protein